jgi:hypothetical protein
MWLVELTNSCAGGCGKRTREQEAEESPLLETVTRELLLETLQATQYLACSEFYE